MSNIEPTEVTRTMRCPTCSVVGTHVIDASMVNEAVLCPACAESGKRSACVAVIEPTEEQKQAAFDFLLRGVRDAKVADDIACLLAEREAKLREELRDAAAVDERKSRMLCDRDVVIDTLRARVAELEAEVAVKDEERTMQVSMIQSLRNQREAQHLADIKALREALASVCVDILTSPAVTDTMWSHRSGLSTTNDYIAGVLGIDTVDEHGKPTAELQRLARYDDAKADAPAVSPDCPRESPECITVGFHAVDECERRPSSFPSECPKCQEGTHPFYDVEQARWLCDRCHHPAGEPFVHVDDDHKNGPCGWSGCGRCGDAEGGEG